MSVGEATSLPFGMIPRPSHALSVDSTPPPHTHKPSRRLELVYLHPLQALVQVDGVLPGYHVRRLHASLVSLNHSDRFAVEGRVGVGRGGGVGAGAVKGQRGGVVEETRSFGGREASSRVKRREGVAGREASEGGGGAKSTPGGRYSRGGRNLAGLRVGSTTPSSQPRARGTAAGLDHQALQKSQKPQRSSSGERRTEAVRTSSFAGVSLARGRTGRASGVVRTSGQERPPSQSHRKNSRDVVSAEIGYCFWKKVTNENPFFCASIFAVRGRGKGV